MDKRGEFYIVVRVARYDTMKTILCPKNRAIFGL